MKISDCRGAYQMRIVEGRPWPEVYRRYHGGVSEVAMKRAVRKYATERELPWKEGPATKTETT